MASSSTVTGLSEARPMHQKAHGEAMVEMGLDQSRRPARRRRRLRRTRSSPSIVASTPLAARPAAVAASRSDSFTRSSLKAVHPGRALGEGGDHREDGIFVDHGRRARGGHVHAGQLAVANPQIGDLLAALLAPVENVDPRAHLEQSGEEARCAAGSSSPPSTTMSEPLTSKAAAIRKAAEDGSAGTTIGRGAQFGPAFERDLAAMLAEGLRSSATRRNSAAFSRYGRGWPRVSMTVVRPGALRPASSTADLICAEATGVRYSIGSGSGVPFSRIGQRPPSACSSTSAPIRTSGSRMRRIGRLRSEASPSKRAVMRMAADHPHHQAEPVPALPKSSVSRGSSKRAEAHAMDAPAPFADPLHLGAERGAGAAGVQDILAFEQARTPGFADAQQAKQKGAMGNALVARRPGAAAQGSAGAGGQGFGGGGMGHRLNLVERGGGSAQGFSKFPAGRLRSDFPR